MALEDDYGMLDGIILNSPKTTVPELEQRIQNSRPFSLQERAQIQHRERYAAKLYRAKYFCVTFFQLSCLIVIEVVL